MNRAEFRKIRKRKLIAYEINGNQIFRLTLLDFTQEEQRIFLRKIRDFSLKEVVKSPAYERFTQIKIDFGRLRIGDFRIFVHRIDEKKWLMLHIFRKKTLKTPDSETQIALNRLKEYLISLKK